MKIKACVNCGECCVVSPCPWGEANEQGGCKFVLFDENKQSTCSIAADIVKCPTSKVSPAFGAGCCRSLYNESRENIIKNVYGGVEQLIELKPL